MQAAGTLLHGNGRPPCRMRHSPHASEVTITHRICSVCDLYEINSKSWSYCNMCLLTKREPAVLS